MRLIAIALNVLLLTTASVLLWRNGFPELEDADFWLAAMVLLAPISSLAAIWTTTTSRSLAGLYFQRKALEEEAKIAELKNRVRAPQQ